MGFLRKLFKGDDKDAGPTYHDLKWGTTRPVVVVIEGNIVQISAYGKFSFSVADPGKFELLGMELKDEDQLAQLRAQLSQILVGKLADALGEMTTGMASLQEVNARQPALAQSTIETAQPAFALMGLKLENFVIEELRY